MLLVRIRHQPNLILQIRSSEAEAAGWIVSFGRHAASSPGLAESTKQNRISYINLVPSQTYRIQIPQDCGPGGIFQHDTGGGSLSVTCPADLGPGIFMEVIFCIALVFKEPHAGVSIPYRL